VFTTRDEPDGTLSVVFGDGVRGARPSSGSNNLRATYRKGLGASGNLRAGQLSQALDRPLGLKAVTNPTPATGGVDPEGQRRARQAIPLPVRTLGRAVSLRDFADFALAFTGIGRAEASVLPLRGGSTVVVSVADEVGGVPASTTVQRLEASLREHADPTVRVRVVASQPAGFRLALKVAVDATREPAAVLAAVEAALRARYGAAARPIGAAVHRSEVIAAAASVVGVVAVDLDRLYRGGAKPTLQDRLLAAGALVHAGAPVGAELLALDPGPLDWCKEMP
jgi:predicted phage baseplate assembly protein